MDKVFADTNIVLDLLAKRDGFYGAAQELFSKADNKEIELYVSALTIATPTIYLPIDIKLMRLERYSLGLKYSLRFCRPMIK